MTLTKQQDNDPSRFDILPGDIIVSFLHEQDRWLIKSPPKRLAGCDPWFVETVYSNVVTGVFAEVPFKLKQLRRTRQPKSVGPDGVPIKARKFRNYKLIRMPRQTPTQQVETT